MPDGSGVSSEHGYQLKGWMLPLTLIELKTFDHASFEAWLRGKVDASPEFFRDSPIVISLEKYAGSPDALDLAGIAAACARHGIKLIATRGGEESLRNKARELSLLALPALKARAAATVETPATAEEPVEPRQTPAATPSEPAPEATASAKPAPRPSNKTVLTSVRGGQQISAPEGDLIIMASVSAGAEVLAAGNIHIYGALRGRALAGIRGDTSAKIFCQSLEAELVSIAGHYKIADQLQEKNWKRPVQAQLKEDVLVVEPLSGSGTGAD